MENTAVKPVLQKRLKRLVTGYNEVPEDFELNRIHDFRLHIKKLNSFLWLLNGGKPEGRLKIKKPLHEFYHRVGAVRNLQLHRQRLAGWCRQLNVSVPRSYLQFLAQKETAERCGVRKEALYLNLKKKLKKLLSAAPKEIKEAAIKNFLINDLAVMQNILKQTIIRDDDLHELRKIFKRFLYVWPWIEDEAVADFSSPFLDKKICDEFSSTLGEFMDSVFSLRFIDNSHSAIKVSAEESKVLQTLQAHIATEKKRQYDTVINDLRNFAGSNGKAQV